MAAFAAAFLFGGVQAFLLKRFLFLITSRRYERAVLFLIVKLALYLAGALLLVLLFKSYVIPCAAGYAAGLPAAVMLWFFYQILRGKSAISGDGNHKNSHNC